ncbi:hypothetical protein BJ878DRAFT_419378, partial [Calycina marina]
LNPLGELPVEEHTLLAARTLLNLNTLLQLLAIIRCFGAASAKDRLDIVSRDAIKPGDIPGPRYLGNRKEIARRDGDHVAGITPPMPMDLTR